MTEHLNLGTGDSKNNKLIYEYNTYQDIISSKIESIINKYKSNISKEELDLLSHHIRNYPNPFCRKISIELFKTETKTETNNKIIEEYKNIISILSRIENQNNLKKYMIKLKENNHISNPKKSLIKALLLVPSTIKQYTNTKTKKYYHIYKNKKNKIFKKIHFLRKNIFKKKGTKN